MRSQLQIFGTAVTWQALSRPRGVIALSSGKSTHVEEFEVCNLLLFLVPFHCGWLVSSNHHGQHSIIDLFLGPGRGGGVCLYNWPFCCSEAYFLMCSALGYPNPD